MKRLALALALAVVMGTAACSVNSATSNVATMDAGATKACADLRDLAGNRAGLSARDLRDRIGQMFTDAQGSANPIIQARAVALYTDATYLAEGAEPGSFKADLAAMEAACRTPSR